MMDVEDVRLADSNSQEDTRYGREENARLQTEHSFASFATTIGEKKI